MEGKIKWFNPMKGFGFIEGEDGQDYFVHHSEMPAGAAPKEGESVSFEAVETDKGKQAQKVVLGGGSSEAPAEEPIEDEAPAEDEASEEPEEEKEE